MALDLKALSGNWVQVTRFLARVEFVNISTMKQLVKLRIIYYPNIIVDAGVPKSNRNSDVKMVEFLSMNNIMLPRPQI